jgi:prevent-host-death family protein
MVTTTPAENIQLRDAKAQLSAVVDAAQAGKPAVITRHGKPAAVVLGYEEYQRLLRARPSFADFLLACPIREEDQHLFERDRRPWQPEEF